MLAVCNMSCCIEGYNNSKLMSIRSCDLWDKFEVVCHQNIENRKKMEEFMTCLQERVDLEEYYSQSIERIGTNVGKIGLEGTVVMGLDGLKSDFINRAEQSKNLAECIQTDIIKNLKQIMKDQNQDYKVQFTNGKIQFKNLKTFEFNLDKSRVAFEQVCKQCDDITLQNQIGMNQIGMNIKQNVNSGFQISKLQKQIEMDQLQKSNKHKYYIQQYNNQVSIFNDEISKIMEQFQQQEQYRIQSIKDSIYKLLVFEVSQIKNLQYDIERISKNVESINGQDDVLRNQQKYIQKEQNLQKITFTDYSSFIKTIVVDQQSTAEIASDQTKNLFQNQFQSYIEKRIQAKQDEKVEFIDEIQEDVLITVIQIVDEVVNGWNGLQINTRKFRSLVQTQYGREIWNACLKSYRTCNKFILCVQGYSNLVELCNVILDEFMKFKDVKGIINVMLLSLTFYKRDDEKVFLQNELVNHPVWKQIDFWKAAIYLSVCEEISNKISLHQKVDKEQTEDYQNIQKTIVFSYLSSLSYNMFLFKVSQNEIKQLMIQFAEYYNLWNLQKQDLTVHVENFVKNPSQMKTMSSLQLSNLVKDKQEYQSKNPNLKSIIGKQNVLSNSSLIGRQSRNSRKIVFKNFESLNNSNISNKSYL